MSNEHDAYLETKFVTLETALLRAERQSKLAIQVFVTNGDMMSPLEINERAARLIQQGDVFSD